VPRLTLILILAVSALLRLLLCVQGGQYYFGDETRYDRGLQLYTALRNGDTSPALALVAMPEHALFVWVGAAVTPVQRALSFLTPHSDWSQPENIIATMWLAAAVLSLFSVLNLFLLHRLTRALGATEAEALWALALFATANTAFYYSRHLLPYDCALSAALSALLIGVTRPTLPRALLCGLVGGLCYGLYNGYWYLVPTVWLAHALACRSAPLSARLRLSAACAGGLVATLAAPPLLGTWIAGSFYWEVLLHFSRTVKQGVFSEGWSLPWEFLWHAEGPLGVALVLGLIAAVLHTLRHREPLPPRIRATLLTLAAAYALLVLLSTGLSRFVVYGRTVKPLVPALCLLGAWAVHRLLTARPRLRPVVFGLLLVSAFTQFAPHFSRTFPREFKIAVLTTVGIPKLATTVSGIMLPQVTSAVTRPDLALVNAQALYPLRAAVPLPAGTTLLRSDHPLSYPPFQYEGYSPRERTLMRTTDLAMRVIKLAAPAAVPDSPPPELLFGSRDLPSGRR
jgi:hypothetical protein